MVKKIQICLSPEVLGQIGRNEVSPDDLVAIEEHVSECLNCREMFDSQYTSSQWSELIQPALSEGHGTVLSASTDELENASSVLKLLGPTDDPNMLGRIGNYEIVGVIGQGGMGVVFKGFDRSLNRFVAIKMLLPHLAASGAARKRFAREGQAVAAVVDDHVMAIHGVDEWQGIPYLVMTYSRGVSLQKRLNDHGPLELREILRIGMQAAKGLAAAHAQGIVHRDIKPSNILLDQNVERVQLVDFGLARAVDDASLTCSGTLAGTPQYMSPEQARAESVDQRSDLFSLGSVIYAMCAGYAPFRADSSYSVLRLIIEKEPRPIREINSDMPDWLTAIIQRLMSKSPDNRFASASEVASIFEQCLAHVQDPMQRELPKVLSEFVKGNKSQWEIVSVLQRWFPIMNDKRIVSLISLLLLLMAFLVPWPIATIGKLDSALAFAGTAALLSMGLALLSRTEYFSRIVLWAFGLSFGIAFLGIGISVPIWLLRYETLAQMERRAEDAQMYAEIQARHKQALADSLASQAKEKKRKDMESGKSKQDANGGSQQKGIGQQSGEPSNGSRLDETGERDLSAAEPVGSPMASGLDLGTRLFAPEASDVDVGQASVTNKGDKEPIEPIKSKSDDSLATAIDRFNERIRSTNVFHDQPPLSKDELIACATWYMKRKEKLPASSMAGVTQIAKQYQIPENWTIEGQYLNLPVRPDLEPVQAFQIYLETDKKDERFEIRKRFLHPPKEFSLSAKVNDGGTGTSLAAAVKQFNSRHTQAAGLDQPRLTEDEVVAAIVHNQTNRDNYSAIGVSDGLFERFQNIARTRQLPEGATLELLPTEVVADGSTYTIWSIAIAMLGDGDNTGRTTTFGVRRQFVSVKHGDAGSIRWGKPAENGLQAGVKLSPPLLSYQIGQTIQVDILYRNILSKSMPAFVPNFPSYKVEVHERDGAVIEVFDSPRQIVGGSREDYFGEQPTVLRGRPIVLASVSSSPDQQAKVLSQSENQMVIFVEPGKSYRLRLLVRNYAKDGEGILKTDEVDFSIADTVAHGAKVDVDGDTGLITIRGSEKEVRKAVEVVKAIQNATQAASIESSQEQKDSIAFPLEMRGKWRIRNAMTLRETITDYNYIAVIDENGMQIESDKKIDRYRLTHWKRLEDGLSYEADLIWETSDGEVSKLFRCLLEYRGTEMTLLRQENEQFSRPKSMDQLTTSTIKFTMVREEVDSIPTLYSPLEAIGIAKQFANDDHGRPIGVKFRVESVHPPFVPDENGKHGHAKSELHLDFRSLPADFAQDQFLVVLTQEAINQLNKLGVENIEQHFLGKEIEVTGRVTSTMYTARGMRGDHFHMIVDNLLQIAFGKKASD